MSLKLGRCPLLKETYCVVYVVKIPQAKDLSYRPVIHIIITSHQMKAMEWLVLAYLRPLVVPSIYICVLT